VTDQIDAEGQLGPDEHPEPCSSFTSAADAGRPRKAHAGRWPRFISDPPLSRQEFSYRQESALVRLRVPEEQMMVRIGQKAPEWTAVAYPEFGPFGSPSAR
jgi:hypothetical protein